MRLIGPVLGGVLLAWAGFDVLVALDVASYLLSAVAIACTRGSPEGGTELLVPFGVQRLGGTTQVAVVLSALGIGFLGGAVLVRWLDRIGHADRAADRVARSAGYARRKTLKRTGGRSCVNPASNGGSESWPSSRRGAR